MDNPTIIKKIFFPDDIKCIFCDGEIATENRYCSCGNCFPAFNVEFCDLCGKAIANSANYCHDCKEGKRYFFDGARAPFVYSGVVKNVVYALKYGNGKYMARYMAEYMADTFYEAGWKVDCITYVPMNEKRLKERGYNQARLLAENFADLIKQPCEDLLDRKVYSKNLARMSRRERAEAIKGSVSLLNNVNVKNKTVLLIDDVMTTSATANECCKALRLGKADKIYVLTFATSRAKPNLY